MLIRVNFRFPDRDEVRYLERLPSQGNFIRSHGATWLVTKIETDRAGGYEVTLRGPRVGEPSAPPSDN